MRLLTPTLVVLVLSVAVGPALAISPSLTASVVWDSDGWLYDITANGATGDGARAWQAFEITIMRPHTPDASYFPYQAHYDPQAGNWFGVVTTAPPQFYAIGTTATYTVTGLGTSVEPDTAVSGFRFWRPSADGWIANAEYIGRDTNNQDYGGGTLDFGMAPSPGGGGEPEVTPELSSASLLLIGALPVGLAWWRRRKRS